MRVKKLEGSVNVYSPPWEKQVSPLALPGGNNSLFYVTGMELMPFVAGNEEGTG
jgi:hypothetical protein